MTARALIAIDLDRTMIYSRSAAGPHFADTEPVCVEIYQGAPLSYMTAAAHTLLAGLSTRASIVPATTRTPDQFRRIALPGGPHRYAVTSNGGAILVDGRADPAWRQRIDREVASSGVSVDTVIGELRTRIDSRWVRNLRTADNLFCYLVVDTDLQPCEFVPGWRAWCEPRGWNVSQQGRKIYTMPNAVSKSAAISDVRLRLISDGLIQEDSVVLAAGDGVLDIDLLTRADSAIRPRHGELNDIDWQFPSVGVTTASGILAGEEILNWFHRNVSITEPTSCEGPLYAPSAE